MASGSRLSPYATPTATRAVLERHGLDTKYTLGQNFLVNDDIVRKIVELAEVNDADHVLEVGPGIGTLTAALLQRAGQVTAIEMDRDLPAVLADTLSEWENRFSLLTMDALDVREQDLASAAGLGADGDGSDGVGAGRGMPNKLVSNLPYAVAATVVLDYLQRFGFIESATVMVQKEVADRMMAKPGTKAYGAYTVKLSLYSHAHARFPVSAGNFYPPPRVESAVIRLDRAQTHDEDARELSADELLSVCRMVDASFATRRKTLANSCKTYFASSPGELAVLARVFERAGVDPRRRGETLDKAEFVRLGLALREETLN